MSGSKERAKPAILTRSPTGRGAAGFDSILAVEMENTAMKKVVRIVPQLAKMALYCFWRNVMAFSIGLVRCKTSARTAKRMSAERRPS